MRILLIHFKWQQKGKKEEQNGFDKRVVNKNIERNCGMNLAKAHQALPSEFKTSAISSSSWLNFSENRH